MNLFQEGNNLLAGGVKVKSMLTFTPDVSQHGFIRDEYMGPCDGGHHLHLCPYSGLHLKEDHH